MRSEEQLKTYPSLLKMNKLRGNRQKATYPSKETGAAFCGFVQHSRLQ